MSTSLRLLVSLGALLVSAQAIAQTAPPPAPTPAPAPYPTTQQAYPPQQQPGAYPQQQPGAYPQQQPGAYPQQQQQQQPGAYPPPAAERGAKQPLSGVAFVPRLGVQFLGSGTLEMSCDGGDCVDDLSGETDYDHKMGFAAGVDVLFQLSPLMRLGPSLMYTLSSDIEPDGGDSGELGAVATLDAVFEFTPQVSPTVWLTPRIMAGLTVFDAKGETEELLDDAKNSCDSGTSVSGCDSFGDPHWGYNIGAGFGAMFGVGTSMRVRADLMLQYYGISLGSMSAENADAELSYGVSGTRYMLLAGIEL